MASFAELQKNFVEGELIEVRAKFGFMKNFTTKLTGADLEENINRQKKNGLDPNTKERYEATFNDAHVNRKGEGTAAEIFINNHIRKAKDSDETYLTATAYRLPVIAVKQEDGTYMDVSKNYENKNLASGQECTLVYRVYKKKGTEKLYVGFEGVKMETEPKLYEGTNNSGWYTSAPTNESTSAPTSEPSNDTSAQESAPAEEPTANAAGFWN